jgi:hypothetical protein
MSTWADLVAAEPEFAASVRAILDAHEHKTIATLRADGSPRISGIELDFGDDGVLTFGSMPRSRKTADLLRDPRFALHSTPTERPDQEAPTLGDVKLTGRAVHAGPLDGEIEGDRFVVDLREVVKVSLNDAATMLVVEVWTAERGLRRTERE